MKKITIDQVKMITDGSSSEYQRGFRHGYNQLWAEIKIRKAKKKAARDKTVFTPEFVKMFNEWDPKQSPLTGTGCKPMKGTVMFEPIIEPKIERRINDLENHSNAIPGQLSHLQQRIAKLEQNDYANCEFVNVLRDRVETLNALASRFELILKDTIKTGDTVIIADRVIGGSKTAKSITKVKG